MLCNRFPRGRLVQGVPGPGMPGLGAGGAWSRGCLLPGGLVSQHALRQTPPGETATAADGMHSNALLLSLR